LPISPNKKTSGHSGYRTRSLPWARDGGFGAWGKYVRGGAGAAVMGRMLIMTGEVEEVLHVSFDGH